MANIHRRLLVETFYSFFVIYISLGSLNVKSLTRGSVRTWEVLIGLNLHVTAADRRLSLFKNILDFVYVGGGGGGGVGGWKES